MSSMKLWELLAEAKKSCDWVELSNVVSEETPHWDGFGSLSQRMVYDFPNDGFRAIEYTIVGQYGTHVDAPIHFCQGMATLDSFVPADLALPLCVVDRTAQCDADCDYELTVQDLLDWEAVNGRIPEGAFVAFRSGWSRRLTDREMDNCDETGAKHYPGWSLEALKFLVEQRNVGSVGHETSDTDSAVTAGPSGFAGEAYILSTGRYQVELLKNLEKLPAVGGVIFTTFPRMKDGTGFPARCFAIVPKP